MSDRKIDKVATRKARERQKAGFKSLDEAFQLPTWLRRLRGIPLATSTRPPYFVAAIAPQKKKGREHLPRRRSDAVWLRKRKRTAVKRARRASRTAR